MSAARRTRSAVPRWHWGEEVGPLAALVARGGILAIPTESSYGLAVDPGSRRGVDAVFAVKRRSADQPLPVVVAGPEHLERLGVDWPSPASGGLERLWPAALSLLLPTHDPLPAAAESGRLAVRVPDHDGLRALLGSLGLGLTATSANRSGTPPVLDPAELEPLLAGRDAIIVDAGALPGGPPSTLVEVAAGVVAVRRRGRVGIETLRRAAAGLEVRAAETFSAATVEIPVEEPAGGP